MKALNWIQTESPGSFVILKAQLPGKIFSSCCQVPRKTQVGWAPKIQHRNYLCSPWSTCQPPQGAMCQPFAELEASPALQSSTEVAPGPFHGSWRMSSQI